MALEKAGNWKSFGVIMALIIYRIVLFPIDDDFIDFSAISVFSMKNMVSTLLADFYFYLCKRHAKKMGVILYCTLLMYTWLMSHIP